MATATATAPTTTDLDLAALSPEQLRRLDEALEGRGVLSFREFVARVNPKYRWYPHCEIIAANLQRVADGELTRLLLLAPPRTGKSEPVSRLFPAYLLYRFPERWVGLTSYTAELATSLSKRARANYLALDGRDLADDSAAAREWATGHGGGMWAAGFGGSMLGKGMHYGLVDDPIKNAEEAESELVASRNRDFFASTFLTRLEPGGALVVVLQRWPGVADFVDMLFEQEHGEEPQRWHVVCLEGVKESEPLEIPASCTLEPDARTPGEPLCEARLSSARMRQMEEASPYFFAAQVQQRPRPRAGVMFPRDKVLVVDAVPVGVRRVRMWDKAGTEGGGKRTAGVLMSQDDAGYTYVEDVQLVQYAAAKRRGLMRTTAEMDGPDVQIHIEQEPGSSGKDSAEADILMLSGFAVEAKPASGDKFTRADPFASQWQAGNVRLLRGEWNKRYLDEMEAARPGAKFLDQMDASSGAFNELATSAFWMV
jgi:predicted phage terminase large subunit-like protein